MRTIWRFRRSIEKMKTLPKHRYELMSEKDIPAVVKLDREACTTDDPDMGPLIHPDAWTSTSLKEFFDERNTTTYLLRDGGGRLVGHLAFRLTPKTFEIVSLSVLPKVRRLGYGSALLNYLADRVLKSDVRKTIIAHVREHDDASVGFYKFHGFRSALVTRHFSDGEDAIKFTYEEDATLYEELELA